MGDKVGRIKDELPGVARVGTPFAEEVKKEISTKFSKLFSNSYSRFSCDDLGPGQWEWSVYLNLGTDSVISGMWKERSVLEQEAKEAEKELESLLEQYRRESPLAANLQLIFGFGPGGEYRTKKRMIKSLSGKMSELERRIETLRKDGHWREETRRGNYKVHPRRLELVASTDFSDEKTEKWMLSLTVYGQGDEKKTEKLINTARDLAKNLQGQYQWLDIRLGFEEEPAFYRTLEK